MVEGAVPQDGIIEKAQSFVDGPVAGHDEAGRPMAVEDEFVQVGGLLGGEPVESQVVEDEQIGAQEGPKGAVHGVVHLDLSHGLGEVTGVYETRGVPGADGRIAQSLGDETRQRRIRYRTTSNPQPLVNAAEHLQPLPGEPLANLVRPR